MSTNSCDELTWNAIYKAPGDIFYECYVIVGKKYFDELIGKKNKQ